MITDAALVLEGGGMRGLYTIGVLDCFLEEALVFPLLMAVSAGAGHGMSYVSGQRGRALRTVMENVHNPRYASFLSLLFTGDFFGKKFVYEDIPERLLPFDFDAYKNSESKLYAVVTNCRTGKPEYLLAADARRDMDMVRASASLPLLSRKVRINGSDYLDGGISDSIPLKKTLSMGFSKSVLVLTQHDGFQKSPSGSYKLMKLRYPRNPALVEAAKNRHLMYNEELAYVKQQEEAGHTFVIRPKQAVQLGRLEKDTGKLRALYQEGYADAKARMPALKAYLQKPQDSIER